MSYPVIVGICEDDLRRDLTFLKAFGGSTTDMRVTPIRGGTLDRHVARVVARQIDDAERAGLEVTAVLVHHDVDHSSLVARRQAVARWFTRLGRKDVRLVICSPAPCTERWLCRIEGLEKRVKGASPAAGCSPWKTAWERGSGNDLDRVRAAALQSRSHLSGLQDFDCFMADWRAAGLP